MRHGVRSLYTAHPQGLSTLVQALIVIFHLCILLLTKMHRSGTTARETQWCRNTCRIVQHGAPFASTTGTQASPGQSMVSTPSATEALQIGILCQALQLSILLSNQIDLTFCNCCIPLFAWPVSFHNFYLQKFAFHLLHCMFFLS